MTVSTREPIVAGGNAERNGGVQQPRAVQVHAEPAARATATTASSSSSGHTRPPATLWVFSSTSTAGRWSTTSSTVDVAARTWAAVSRPAMPGQADREEPGVRGGAAELVDDDVRVLLGDEHVARAGRAA